LVGGFVPKMIQKFAENLPNLQEVIMATIRAIIAFIKNWKSIIPCLTILCIDSYVRHPDLSHPEHQIGSRKDKVAAYEAMIKAQKAHQQRLEKIAHDTGKIAQQIRSLNLDKERCQNDEYYKVANDIVKRFND